MRNTVIEWASRFNNELVVFDCAQEIAVYKITASLPVVKGCDGNILPSLAQRENVGAKESSNLIFA
jgi:hypothetical protein